MVRLAVLVLATACGDNLRGAPDAAPPPDAPPLPDLTLVGNEMVDTVQLVAATFGAADCAIAEACVGGPGARLLLRFDTVTANRGEADLVLGSPPAAGVSDAMFVWSTCHMHHHIASYAEYVLRDAAGAVITGHKQAFCLQDVEEVVPGSGTRGYSCLRQGLSVGWADVYNRDIPCQWIDVTGVAPGTYTLEVRINENGALPDRDLANNSWSTPVVL